MIRRFGPAFAIVLALSSITFAAAPRSAIGPVLPGEDQLLWDLAQEDLQAGKIDQASLKLERLVERLPANPHAIDAQKLLGEVELRRGRPARALHWLELAAANLRNESTRTVDIDLLRGHAYLAQRKNTQALLVSEKLLTGTNGAAAPAVLSAQILKTRALLELRQTQRARDSLEAARTRAAGTTEKTPELTAWLEALELRGRELECATLPSSGKLTEEQAIDQLTRLVECTRTAKAQFEKTKAAAADSPALREAEASWERARVHLEKSCSQPPTPPGKRTRAELRTYLAELKAEFSRICSRQESP